MSPNEVERGPIEPALLGGALVVVVLLALVVIVPPAPARDDFLRGTSRELTARERQALDERIGELGNPDPDVRNRAVSRLAVVGKAAVPALVEVLKKGSDPKQVSNACLALSALGDSAGFAQLERFLLDGGAAGGVEDVARATLFALGRAPGYPSTELSEGLRRLATQAPLQRVRESAILAAGARRVVGLSDVFKAPLQNEKVARVLGCMLVALAESGDPATARTLTRFLDGRKVRDEMLRRAALCAVARSGDPALLGPLLKFVPDTHEVAAYAVALGAFPDQAAADAAVVQTLERLLVRERERAAAAVYSLAAIATEPARDLLRRALEGEFSAVVQEAACLACSSLVDQQRFLPALRRLAAAPAPGARAAALLALARMGDPIAAATAAAELGEWREPRVLGPALLLCAVSHDRPVAELLPAARRGPVAGLFDDLDGIQRGMRDPRLLPERIARELTAARGHWLLQRDDLRLRVVHELLELDKVVFVAARSDDGGSAPPAPPTGGDAPPSDPGGSGGTGGSGGAGGDGSGGSGGSGDSGGDGSSGGEGGSGGDTDGGGSSGGPPPPGDGNPGGSGGRPAGAFDGPGGGTRRGKPDTARFELDLRRWMDEFPLFECADPFAR